MRFLRDSFSVVLPFQWGLERHMVTWLENIKRHLPCCLPPPSLTTHIVTDSWLHADFRHQINYSGGSHISKPLTWSPTWPFMHFLSPSFNQPHKSDPDKVLPLHTMVRGEMVICPQAFVCFSTWVGINATWPTFIAEAHLCPWEGVPHSPAKLVTLSKRTGWSSRYCAHQMTMPHSTWWNPGMSTAAKDTTHCLLWVWVIMAPHRLLSDDLDSDFSSDLSKLRIEDRNRAVHSGNLTLWIHHFQGHLLLSLCSGLDSEHLQSWPRSCEPSWSFTACGDLPLTLGDASLQRLESFLDSSPFLSALLMRRLSLPLLQMLFTAGLMAPCPLMVFLVRYLGRRKVRILSSLNMVYTHKMQLLWTIIFLWRLFDVDHFKDPEKWR